MINNQTRVFIIQSILKNDTVENSAKNSSESISTLTKVTGNQKTH